MSQKANVPQLLVRKFGGKIVYLWSRYYQQSTTISPEFPLALNGCFSLSNELTVEFTGKDAGRKRDTSATRLWHICRTVKTPRYSTHTSAPAESVTELTPRDVHM